MSQKQNVSTKTHSKPCNCGCSECESVNCQLDCLVQPRFFHGQVLSDQDLTQLLHWTQSKLRLNRFRDGWGVVCGLEVRCACDPKQPGKVTVLPGYALSCCGDDIIICEPQCVDLSVVFKDTKDPCATPRRSTNDATTKPDPIQIPLFSGLSSDVYKVDLFAHYDEVESEPKTTLGRGNCRELGQCENTRIREITTIIPRLADTGSYAATDAWEKKGVDYTRLVLGLKDAYQRYSEQKDIVQFRKWLMDWLVKHPLHHFCFVNDWLQTVDLSAPVGFDRIPEDERKANEERVRVEGNAVDVDQIKIAEKKLAEGPNTDLSDPIRAALGWIALDMLIDTLQCDCGSATDDQADVPLARVWVQKSQDGRKGTQYQVLAVDDQPPFRRPLGLDCWPAPIGSYNLGRFIWRKKDEAAAELRHMGIDMPSSGRQLSDVALLDQVSGLDFSRSFYGRAGESIDAITIKSEVFDERIVGFGK